MIADADDGLPDWPPARVPAPVAAAAPAAPPLRVFIGSTWLDLIAEREAVERALNRLRAARFVGMEYFGAQSTTTRESSLVELERCDVYVGIIGYRYGSGITEAEYRRARERNLPCLVYLKTGGQPLAEQSPADLARLQSFRQELGERHTVVGFERPEQLATCVVADLHNLLFDRLLVQGIAQLGSDFDRRIRLFLAEYLGTPEQPMAFGGRDAELAVLDRWLDDPAAAPYALVCGPAGRGKSALLVHWAQRLLQRAPDPALLFFPISIRFRTNLAAVAFASLSARLAWLRGEAVAAGIETPTEVWREILASALARPLPAGTRILLILDAADEAADWQPGPDLFPARPPAGLKILVSARSLAGDRDSGAWLERLGWERRGQAQVLDLDPLTPLGLTQVLRRMSVPLETLSRRTDVVAELFRLSQGDPLLVNLYVADLWNQGEQVARLQPEDLAAIDTGLEGYFRRWWNDQRALWGANSPLREPAVQEVLNTLACALGPLLTAELLQLVPASAGLSVWGLDETLRVLQRFVVGDGMAHGYAFSHPRLADYFYERLDQAAQARALEMRFVAWGRATVAALEAGQLPIAAVPAYVLRFQRRHMERAGSEPAALMSLAGNSWAAAWERLDRGSYIGFLGDLAAVRLIAQRENRAEAASGPLPFIAQELRCALGLASVAGLASGLSSALLLAHVQKAAWTPAQALSYAARINDDRQRLATIVELTALMPEAHRPLGLAACVAELRALDATAKAMPVITAVINDWNDDGERPLARPHGTLLVDVLCQAAAQESPALLARVYDVIVAILANGPKWDIPDELCAAAFCRIGRWAPQEYAQSSTKLALSCLRRLALEPTKASVEHRALRLRLLREMRPGADDDDAALLTDALRAATALLAQHVATAAAAPCAEALGLLLESQPFLPPDERIATLEALAPVLTAAQLEALLAEPADGLAASVRLHGLVALRERGDPALQPRVNEALSYTLARPDLPIQSLQPVLARAAAWLPAAQRAALLERLALTLDPVKAIARLRAIARYWASAGIDANFGNCLCTALRRVARPRSTLDALAGLLALLEPDGAGDSFAAWRPQRGASRLEWPIRELLGAGRAPRSLLLEIAGQLADALPRRTYRDERAALLSRLGQLSDASGADCDSDTPADPRAEYLLLRHYEGTLDADELIKMPTASGAGSPAAALQEVLERLFALSRWISGEPLGEALAQLTTSSRLWPLDAAQLTDLVAGLAARLPYPPAAEPLAALGALARAVLARGDAEAVALVNAVRSTPMRDATRAALFGALLSTSRPTAAEHAANWGEDLVLDVGRFAAPPDSLVNLALALLAGAPYAAGGGTALERLAPHVRPASIARWVDAVASVAQTGFAIDELVAHDLARQPDAGRERVDSILEALRQTRSPTVLLAWIGLLAGHRDVRLDRELLPLARTLDGQARLTALTRLAAHADAQTSGELLREALAVARDVRLEPPTATALMRAVAARPKDASLIADATAVAIAFPERFERSAALAILAPVMEASDVIAAATVLRRLDDGAARVRALKALVEAIADPTARAAARQDVVRALPAQLSDAGLAPALLVLAAWLPPEQRWTAIADAARQPGRAGFSDEELLDALTVNLPGAPARVLRQSLRWLSRFRPSRRRALTVARLLPHLPLSMRAAATQLLDRHADQETIEAAACWVDENTLDELEQNRGRLSGEQRRALQRVDSERRWLDATRLTPALPDATLQLALQRCRSELGRAHVIGQLGSAENLSTSGRRILVAAVAQIGDADLARSAAACLAVFGGEATQQLAALAVELISSPAGRAAALARLARRSPAQRGELIGRALTCAAAESDPMTRAYAALDLAVQAPECLPSALTILEEVNEPAVLGIWRHLIETVADDGGAQLVERAARHFDEPRFSWLIEAAADALGEFAADTALRHANGLAGDMPRARILAAVAARLPESAQTDAGKVLDTLSADYAWLAACGALCRRWPALLDAPRARTACAMLSGLQDDERVAGWLGPVAAHWPAAAVSELWQLVLGLGDEAARADALHALIRGGMPAAGLREAGRRLSDPHRRAVVLGHLAARATPPDAILLAEALADARRSGGREQRVRVLAEMALRAGVVEPPVLHELLAAYRAAPRELLAVLATVEPLLGAAQAVQVAETLLPPRRLDDIDAVARLLGSLAERLLAADPGVLPHHLARLCTERSAIWVIAAVVEWLTDADTANALFDIACGLRSRVFRTQALLDLLPVLDESHQMRALDRIAATEHEIARLQAFLEALARLTPGARKHLLTLANDFSDADRAARLRAAIDALEHDDTDGSSRPNNDEGDESAFVVGELGRIMNRQVTSTAPPSAAHELHRPTLRSSLARLRALESLPDRLDFIRRQAPDLPVQQRIELAEAGFEPLSGERLLQTLRVAETLISTPLPASWLKLLDVMPEPETSLQALALLAPRLENTARAALYAQFSGLLSQAQKSERSALLDRMPLLVPLVRGLGGDAALRDCVRAVCDVGSLWP